MKILNTKDPKAVQRMAQRRLRNERRRMAKAKETPVTISPRKLAALKSELKDTRKIVIEQSKNYDTQALRLRRAESEVSSLKQHIASNVAIFWLLRNITYSVGTSRWLQGLQPKAQALYEMLKEAERRGLDV